MVYDSEKLNKVHGILADKLINDPETGGEKYKHYTKESFLQTIQIERRWPHGSGNKVYHLERL